LRVPKFGRFGFLYTKNTARRRSARVCTPPARDCPDLGREAYVFECLECGKYKVWHERDGFKRCYYEFKELESKGFYDGTWDSHPENFLREDFERLQEQRRTNEQVNREFEIERPGLEKRAEELEEKFPESYFSKYNEPDQDGGEDDLKNRHGDVLMEEDEEDEEPDQPDEDDEEDYF